NLARGITVSLVAGLRWLAVTVRDRLVCKLYDIMRPVLARQLTIVNQYKRYVLSWCENLFVRCVCIALQGLCIVLCSREGQALVEALHLAKGVIEQTEQ